MKLKVNFCSVFFRIIVVKLSFLTILFILPTESIAGEIKTKIRASTGQKFDDNINYSKNDRKADFISDLKVGVDLNVENKRYFSRLSVDIIQELFWDNTENQNMTELFNGEFTYNLSKFDKISVSDKFTHTDRPMSFEEEFESNGRFNKISNIFDVYYEKEFSSDLYGKIGYGNDINRANRDDVLDSTLNRLFVEGGMLLESKNIISARYDYLTRDLDPGGSVSFNSLSVNMKQYLTDKVSFEGRVGVDFIETYNDNTFAKPSWSVRLVDQFTKTEESYIAFVQRYSTNPYTEDVYNSWRISTGLNSKLSKKMEASADLFYGASNYETLSLKEKMFGIKFNLDYDISKDMNGNFSYTCSVKNSNDDSREYLKNVVFLGLSTDF